MSTPTFPLPDGYFRPLQYTPEDLARWKHRVVQLVQRTLRDEQSVSASNYDRVDLNTWKLAKRKDQLRVYKPRHGSAAVTSPCVLTVGTIAGKLEDVVYGIHNTTTRDLRVTRRFLSDTAVDAAMLHVFESGTDADPYRSFSLKWRAVQTPAGSLVKDRDACVLDYMGIDRDETGRRYAFHISESLEHAVCPPFTAQGIVRADAHVYTIYRELDNGRVGVYFYGVYNMSGHIPKIFAGWTATAVACSVANSVRCAEAKKLSALAVRNQHSAQPKPTMLCSICRRGSSKACHVCNMSVCSKCCSYRYLLTEKCKIRVTCCKQCIVVARQSRIDPRQPLRLVSLSAWMKRGEIRESVPRTARTRSIRQRRCSRDDGSARSNAPHSELSSPRKVSQPSPPIRLTPRKDKEQFASRVVPMPPPMQRATSAPEIWETMKQLRDAAEHTAQLTHEVNMLMEATVEPSLRSMRRGVRDRART